MTKLQNPFVAGGLSLLVSLLLGITLCWRASAPLLALAAAAPQAKKPAVERVKGWDFWTIEIENLSAELKGERERLRKQSDLLDQRAGRLASEEKELAKVRADIEQVRKTITDKIVEISADEIKNIGTLAKTYASLSPRAVVAIVREMDDNTVIKIFSLMKTDIVSPIFEEMSRTAGTDGPLSKRAAILSEKMRQLKPVKPAN